MNFLSNPSFRIYSSIFHKTIKKGFFGLIKNKNSLEKTYNTRFLLNKISRRGFSSEEETVNIKFKYMSDGKEVDVKAPIGENILRVAHQNDIDLEGACDCSLACSTCHVILEQELYDKLPEAEEEEEDLLDLVSHNLTLTSRLGCQIIVSKELEGTVITLPSFTANLYVDGHKPKPH